MSAALGESKAGYMFPSGIVFLSSFMPSQSLIVSSTPIPPFTTLWFFASLHLSSLDPRILFILNYRTDYVYPSDRDDAAQNAVNADGGMSCTIFSYLAMVLMLSSLIWYYLRYVRTVFVMLVVVLWDSAIDLLPFPIPNLLLILLVVSYTYFLFSLICTIITPCGEQRGRTPVV